MSQRLESMKKSESNPIINPNPTTKESIFRNNHNKGNKRSNLMNEQIKLVSITKRFTALNETRLSILRIENFEMGKPRPPSPTCFSKPYGRKYVNDEQEEGEEEEEEERKGKVKWQKPIAIDLEEEQDEGLKRLKKGGERVDDDDDSKIETSVPRKGILLKCQLDEDGNLIDQISDINNLVPEFVIVRRKVEKNYSRGL
ncbi:hypothetical protein CROQUDRAFT_673016 [Cronartium quercuum f. sp. fusiforme G11]|uniref:Uncharacterized protein n=1 Tax=Cronartium quercuum f. sp. fusiforme G11 TaxID=708437 RepID=A0A9P6T981_9BASI|nr:hypothetical protein CROQUDRAFT_673016 [Cronartium quercuum f. sp. fusiforme G11]